MDRINRIDKNNEILSVLLILSNSWLLFYSYLSATIGSTFVAFRAGM
jgi:hypothetical protein